jgi:ATP phosphoribosyltransferase regulatory subunit HisZ
LTASFGRPEPAVGFVLELDKLTDALMGRSHDSALLQEPIEATQAGGESLNELFAAARTKRAQGERVLLNTSEVMQ